RGHVTKQGSRMLRWALIEAIQRAGADTVTGAIKDAIIARRGKQARNIAKVAAARRLLTLVFYGIRDGQIRCLSTTPGGSPPTTPGARFPPPDHPAPRRSPQGRLRRRPSGRAPPGP